MKYAARVVLLMTAGFSLVWAQGTEVKDLLKEGRDYLFKGESGDKGAVKKALKVLEKAAALDPGSALARAFLGTAYNLTSKNETVPWEQMKWVKKGMASHDKAVKMAPGNIWVRMERGANSLRMPGFFNRLPLARQDFDYLVKQIDTGTDAFILEAEGTYVYLKEDAHPRDFAKRTRQTVYYYAGLVYEKMDEPKTARQFWGKAAALGADTKYGKKAAEKLAGKGK